jgi:hypothetical protein
MSRALALTLVALVAACRIGFDPLDEQTGQGDEAAPEMESTSSQVITAQPGTDFFTTCRPAEPCIVDCSLAATCIVDCNGASSCDVICAEADCLVEACVAPACEVDCGTSTVVTLGAIATCD